MKKPLKTLLLIIWCNFFVLSLCGLVQGETSDDTPWQILETKYTEIRYQSLKDLKKFNKKIDYSPGGGGLSELFSNSDPKNLREKVKKKLDSVFLRVQKILGMRKKMNKIKIVIYPNKKKLHFAYKKIYKTSFRSYKASSLPRAWYIFEFNTIYLNVRDTHEGMLAHEMAHAIIDHYLKVRPPKATAEILARYVDKHLMY